MTQNVVLDGQGELRPEPSSIPLSGAVQAPSIDPVPLLAEACWRQAALLTPAVPVKRPFDAQYWACWLVTAVFPVVLGYILLTR